MVTSVALILICHHIVSVSLVKFYENDGAKFVMTVVHVSSIWVDMICYLFYNCLILRIFTTFPKDVGGSVVNTKFLLNDVFSGLGGAKIWYIFSKMRLRHTQLRSTPLSSGCFKAKTRPGHAKHQGLNTLTSRRMISDIKLLHRSSEINLFWQAKKSIFRYLSTCWTRIIGN